MIVTLSGYDGVGKSTSVELLRERICKEYNLTGVSIFDINDNTENYESVEQIDYLYEQLSKYDVISTRFYLRGKKMQEVQNAVMFTGIDVFKNVELIKETAKEARKEAQIWYQKVVSRLLAKNKIVIYDRYYFDEVAYRSLYSVSKEFVEELYVGYKKPDISLFLYADMELIKKRNAERIDTKTALFKSQEKMDELFQNMEYMRKKYSMKVIDVCDKNREEVTEDIFKIVKPQLELELKNRIN